MYSNNYIKYLHYFINIPPLIIMHIDFRLSHFSNFKIKTDQHVQDYKTIAKLYLKIKLIFAN